jgi:hypothetical protein
MGPATAAILVWIPLVLGQPVDFSKAETMNEAFRSEAACLVEATKRNVRSPLNGKVFMCFAPIYPT